MLCAASQRTLKIQRWLQNYPPTLSRIRPVGLANPYHLDSRVRTSRARTQSAVAPVRISKYMS
eukprot:3714537-Amphidinium_carterae.1